MLTKTWHQIFIIKCWAYGISKYSMLTEVMCAVIKFDVMFGGLESIKFLKCFQNESPASNMSNVKCAVRASNLNHPCCSM